MNFKAMPGELRVGDFVAWNTVDDGRMGREQRGRIMEISTDGELTAGDTGNTIMGTAADPVAMITIYFNEEPTEEVTVVMFSSLTKIEMDKSGHQDMQMKRMIVPFELKQMDEGDDDDDMFQFEGYASTFGNVDRGMDRIMQGAFKQTLRNGKQLPVLWQHDPSMPLGVYAEMREDMRGLFVRGMMPKQDDFVRGRVMPQMKAGSITAMSIGYMTRDYEIEGDVRNLKEVDLFEISLVTIPMNVEAEITAMKSIDIETASNMSKRDIEKALTSGVKFSRSTAKKLASVIETKLREAEGSEHREDVVDNFASELANLNETLKKGL